MAYLSVLPRETVIRNHCYDLVSAGSFSRIDHQQQFHEVIGGRKSTLHKEHIIASDAFEENGLKLTVAEFLDIDFANGGAKALGNFFCQLLRPGAGKKS